MKLLKITGLLAIVAAVSACSEGGPMVNGANDKTRDFGIDEKSLTELKAGIWVDPNGCQHWIIDDGVEGYMDARRTPDGRAVCDDAAQRNTASGDFKSGGTELMGDPI
jgi:hypothetical protein